MKIVSSTQIGRIRKRFNILYGEANADRLVRRYLHTIGRYGVSYHPVTKPNSLWDKNEAVLITYADMIHSEDGSPLTALNEFCNKHLRGTISTVHLLPFYPYSSDDGFSVIDYRAVTCVRVQAAHRTF